MRHVQAKLRHKINKTIIPITLQSSRIIRHLNSPGDLIPLISAAYIILKLRCFYSLEVFFLILYPPLLPRPEAHSLLKYFPCLLLNVLLPPISCPIHLSFRAKCVLHYVRFTPYVFGQTNFNGRALSLFSLPLSLLLSLFLSFFVLGCIVKSFFLVIRLIVFYTTTEFDNRTHFTTIY